METNLNTLNNPPENTLTWSTQLSVTPSTKTPKLPGDRINLPQSALEQLLAAAPLQTIPASSTTTTHPHTSTFDPFNPHTFAAESRARQHAENRQQQLPHPLTFRIGNPDNGRFVYAGIREFSAPENEVALSALLRDSLGISDESVDFDGSVQVSAADTDTATATATATETVVETSTSTSTNGTETKTQPETDSTETKTEIPRARVTVHAKQLPKGTYVRLRPLEAGYDPEDWKALLERHLRDNFTTLTVGEILTVPTRTRRDESESFRFLLDKVYPEGEEGICVIDTDLEVDIVALSEEQARETVKRRLERAVRAAPGSSGGSSVGGVLSGGESVQAQVLSGEYVDYEVRDWRKEKDTVRIEVVCDDDDDSDDGSGVQLFVSPLSARQRGRPRRDMYAWGQFSGTRKIVTIRPSNVALEGAEALYISVHAESSSEETRRDPVRYRIRVLAASDIPEGDEDEDAEEDEMHEADDVQCQNCRQWVPQRTLILHENFCLRNNILCTQCQTVFQKRSPEWENHWHCPHDSAHGTDTTSKARHDSIFHTETTCPDCPSTFESLPSLATHRTTTCPGKLILCQFCHLLVPQKSDSDPDLLDPEVLLSGLTPHELIDGSRTTDCHLCSKIIRLRDMNTHLRHHDLERRSRPTPRICLNQNCARTIPRINNNNNSGTGAGASAASLGLCTICFGPLYVDTHDPEGKALRRRIERRYLSQLMSGCGKPWCQNRYCKNGRAASNSASDSASASANANSTAPNLSVPEIMKITRPLVDALNLNLHLNSTTRASTDADATTLNTAPFYFCSDETGQGRRILADMLFAEGNSHDQGQDQGQNQGQGNAGSDNVNVNGDGDGDGVYKYDLPWCIAGVEAAGGDLEKTREWLGKWAPVRGERGGS